MYYLEKKMEVSSSHKLCLDYESKCQTTHGHNWWLTVYCKSQTLDDNGMIIDFTHIKKIVNQLDHAHLNDIIDQPTAENIAKWVCHQIPFCYKVKVQESSGNIVIFEVD